MDIEAKGRDGGKSDPVWVHGYLKKEGTYVSPHYRSAPDGNFSNNWSTYGNVNPYTSKEGNVVMPPNRSLYYQPPIIGYENNAIGRDRKPVANRDNQNWIDQSCPKHLGPSLWKDCVRIELHALKSGMPKLDGISIDNQN